MKKFDEIFTTNSVESINAELKKFITIFKKIIDSQEHQYDEAISRTRDVSFSLPFKHLEVDRKWFQWDSTKAQESCF